MGQTNSMTVLSEYKVIGGLLGLGPDIFLEILSEIRYYQYLIQLLGGCVGIAQETYNFPVGTFANYCPHNQHIGIYYGSGLYGAVCCKGTETKGNSYFYNNQTVKLEFDSEKGTLIFFVNGLQQPVYISGIKEKVRFVIFMFWEGSSCTIKSLKNLKSPTSGHVKNEKAIQW
ncbi:MAG: hypothetical protein EZS28_040424 [Streblomastix strix]|uniref:B30.2/SPRY domain-containing protein n=1 Tax=Streblomastix strix TaxID=222440 RepID=A0A5J4U199_9EUKA|nr:MAG: hypothetical protein EZS28_040424 [Streblomastix strix]